jgi:hypothetical protein
MKSFQIFALLALFMLIVVYNNKTKEGAGVDKPKPKPKQTRRGAGGLSAGTNKMYGGGKINSKQV